MTKDEQDPAWQPVREVNGRLAGTRFADYLVGGAESNVITGGAGRDTAYVDRLDVVLGVERVRR